MTSLQQFIGQYKFSILGVALVAFWFVSCGHRPRFLPLVTHVDGAKMQTSESIILFLHGYGGSNSDVAWLVEPAFKHLKYSTTLMRVQAPFGWWGRSWYGSPQQKVESRERVQEIIEKLEKRYPQAQLVLAGFSQGASMALEVASQSPQIKAAVALSPCLHGADWAATAQKRSNLKVWVVSGTADILCSHSGSQQIAEEFKRAGNVVQFLPFQENHIIEETGFKALAEAALSPAVGHSN